MSRDWTQIIDDYESSGLTAKKYCENHNLVYSTFATVKSKMERQNKSSRFLPVVCSVEENISFIIDRHKIEIDSSIDDNTLRRIIGALKYVVGL